MLSLIGLLGSINPTTVRHCLIAINNVSKLPDSSTLLTDCIQRAVDPPANYSTLTSEEKIELLRKMYGISSLELGQRVVGQREDITSLLVGELATKEPTVLYFCSGTLGTFYPHSPCSFSPLTLSV